MSKRLFDHDPLTGERQYFHWNEADESFTIETEQDCEGLVEQNRREFNAAPGRGNGRFKGDMHRVASLPLNVYMELRQQGILDDQKALRKWLNDPNNRYYRTRPGRV